MYFLNCSHKGFSYSCVPNLYQNTPTGILEFKVHAFVFDKKLMDSCQLISDCY